MKVAAQKACNGATVKDFCLGTVRRPSPKQEADWRLIRCANTDDGPGFLASKSATEQPVTILPQALIRCIGDRKRRCQEPGFVSNLGSQGVGGKTSV